MNWKTIRLELAQTGDFPAGSPSRAYLLRLPLDESGLIEVDAIEACPRRATVRRFWPNQADLSGHVIRTSGGWAFSYRGVEDRADAIVHLESRPLRLGGHITLTEPDGMQLPFRIASIKSADLLTANGAGGTAAMVQVP